MTNTRRSSLAILIIILAAGCLAAGCGGAAYTHFRPAGDYEAAGTGWVAQRTYNVPPDTRAVTVRLAARGQTDTNDRGVEFAALHVRVGIENTGEKGLTLKTKDIRLLDDEGNAAGGADAYAGRDRAGAITVAGGASATYELVFDLPPETRLSDLGSVRLEWPYVYDGTERTVTTKFLRIEEVHYYRPGYHRRPYYYDPWYDPYWYGPYPRHRFGYGYYHGW